MGFNRRKMEDQRGQAAEKEATTRRATDAQVLEDAERLIAAWNERQALRAHDLFAHDRRRHQSRLLVPVDTMPGLPNNQRDRLAYTRSSPRRSRVELDPFALLPLMPTQRAVRGACALIANEHR